MVATFASVCWQLCEVSQRYAAGITWVGNTMSTVGYGYIGPCSTEERIFAIVSMVTACATFAIIIGSLQKVPPRAAQQTLSRPRVRPCLRGTGCGVSFGDAGYRGRGYPRGR